MDKRIKIITKIKPIDCISIINNFLSIEEIKNVLKFIPNDKYYLISLISKGFKKDELKTLLLNYEIRKSKYLGDHSIRENYLLLSEPKMTKSEISSCVNIGSDEKKFIYHTPNQKDDISINTPFPENLPTLSITGSPLFSSNTPINENLESSSRISTSDVFPLSSINGNLPTLAITGSPLFSSNTPFPENLPTLAITNPQLFSSNIPFPENLESSSSISSSDVFPLSSINGNLPTLSITGSPESMKYVEIGSKENIFVNNSNNENKNDTITVDNLWEKIDKSEFHEYMKDAASQRRNIFKDLENVTENIIFKKDIFKIKEEYDEEKLTSKFYYKFYKDLKKQLI